MQLKRPHRIDGGSVLWWIMCVVLVALLLPALCYSLDTPFGLVDDYGDWAVARWRENPSTFREWASTTFLGRPTRYRPFFELYNFATWSLLGPRPAAHHLARWALLFLAALFAARMLRLALRFGEARPTRVEEAVPMGLAVFLGMFLFFPNQPVARLAPQELPAVLFCSMAMWAVTRMLASGGAALATARWSTVVLLLVSCLGLSLSKEPTLVLLGWILLWLMFFHARPLTAKVAGILACISLLLLFSAWRAYAVHTQSGYGTAALSPALLRRNAAWLLNDAFQWRTSPLITAGILALLVVALIYAFRGTKLRDEDSLARIVVFLVGGLAATAVMAMTSWYPVPRYWYPMVLPMSLLCALGAHIAVRGERPLHRLIRGGVALWLLFFVAANYHNTLLQFLSQHHARHVEARMLNEVEALFAQGEAVSIGYAEQEPDIELTWHARLYFAGFRPFFRGAEPVEPASTKNPEDVHIGRLVSPRNAEPLRHRTVTWAHAVDYALLAPTARIAATLQGRRAPYTYLDAGVHDFDYAWYCHEPIGAGNGERD